MITTAPSSIVMARKELSQHQMDVAELVRSVSVAGGAELVSAPEVVVGLENVSVTTRRRDG